MDLAANALVILDFEAADEKASILAVAGLLKEHPAVADFAVLQAAIWERQCVQPPLLGNGIALPHARTAAVTSIVFAIGRCRNALPFGDAAAPVKLIFLYAAPPDQVAQSLAIIAALAKKLHQPEILKGLLEADSEMDFRKWLA